MWTIYSIGDYHYLQSVLNNVAALVGTGLPYQLAAIGMMLGILLMGFQAIATGGRMIQFQNLLLGWLLFGLFFGPGTTVVIQDVYSLNTVNVDNVPFGVAAVGSIMSNIGYEITSKLEQAFSLPKMTQEGFAGSLSLLLKTRNLPLGAANTDITGDPNTPKGDLSRTLSNYVKDCTLTGIQKDEKIAAAIPVAENPWAAMRYESAVFGTRTYLPDSSIDPPEGTNRTCTEAHDRITEYLNDNGFWDGWNSALENELGTDALGKTQAALDQLVSVGLSSRSYLLGCIMRDAYELGIKRNSQDTGNWAEAMIIADARNKRNVQWASESSLFMTVVRPMMTYFEGFFYALSPFYAFLVVLIPAGIGMAGKYLLTAIWIQTWMPVLAILNHYLNFIAKGKLASLQSEISLTSMEGLARATGEMSNWIGTAGMLAASTPAITLTLVYGGSVAATHLAGRLAGGDHVNENTLAPDPLQNKELVNMAQGFNHDAQAGLRRFGADRVLPSVTFGDDISSSVSSSLSERESAMQQFGQQWGQVLGSNSQLQERFSNGQAIRSSQSTSNSQAASYLQRMTETIGGKATLTNSQKETLAGILGGSLAAGKGGAGVSAGLRQEFSSEQASAIQKVLDSMGTAENGYGMKADFQKALAHDVTQSKENFATEGMSLENKEALTQSAQKAISADKAFQTANQRSAQFGMQTSLKGDDLAHRLVQSGADAKMVEKARSLGLGEKMNTLASRFGQNLGKGEALALGAAVALDQAAHRGGSEAGAAREALLEGISRAQGYAVDPTGGRDGDPATQFQGISGGAEKAGNEAHNAAQNANLAAQTPSASDIRNGVAQARDETGVAVAGADGAIASQAGANFGGVQTAGKTAQDNMRQQIAQEVLSWTKKSMADQSTARSATEKVSGFIESVVEGSGIAIAHMAAGVDGTIRAGGEAWNKFKASTSNLAEQVRSGDISATEALKQLDSSVGTLFKETGKGFDEGARLSAQVYWERQRDKAREIGLTEEQASLYADYRSDFVNRALGSVGMRDGGAGDLTTDGSLAKALHGPQNEFHGRQVDPVIGKAIAFAAQSGDEGYLEKVAQYNHMSQGGGGQMWYESPQGTGLQRGQMTPDMIGLLNPDTVGGPQMTVMPDGSIMRTPR